VALDEYMLALVEIMSAGYIRKLT